MLFKYQLGEVLGKTIGEIEAMPASEFTGWAGYFLFKERERAKQEAIAKAKARAKGSGRVFGGRGGV
jgi:hypothetical protein